MIRRLLAVAALLVAGFVTAAPHAAAQYEGACGFVINPPGVVLGGEVHIMGAGFEPGSTVTFLINGQFLGSAVAGDDVDGPIDATFTVPSSLPDGEYYITTSCEGLTSSQTIIVGDVALACGVEVFQPGDFVVLTLPGFDPGSHITVTINAGPTTLYSGPVSGNPMTVGVQMPTNVAGGEYLIEAVGTDLLDNEKTLVCPIFADVPEPPPLPVAGASSTMLLVRAGLLLITAGGVLFMFSRRRTFA